MGLLDPGYVDDNFGPQLDRAVREFQRTLGYPVDGVFRPEFVLYVGPDFTVGTVSIQLGDQVAPGAEIVRGAPPVLRAEIVGVDLRPLPPFSGGPLSLEIAGTTFTVDGTSLEGEAVAGIAQGLAALSMSGELIDGDRLGDTPTQRSRWRTRAGGERCHLLRCTWERKDSSVLSRMTKPLSP